MSDQDPLHMATDSQEGSQREFDFPHWFELRCSVLHEFIVFLLTGLQL